MSYQCELCPRLCNVDREKHLGICKSGREMVVRAALPHFFEEPPVSGTKGSGAIFFAGCALHCEYCQNKEISEKAEGKIFLKEGLVALIKGLEERGVHNINLVTGTHFADKIVEALQSYRPYVPVVWNTSGYERLETIEKLLPYIDIFLVDYKYSDKELAKRYSGTEDYPAVAVAAIDLMVKSKTLQYSADGIMEKGVIVRHLVLPGAQKNSKNVIKLFASRWAGRAIFSLMGQYTPNGTEIHPELQRPLKPLEYRIAVSCAEKQGLDDFFVQEKGSVGKEFVPNFNCLL